LIQKPSTDLLSKILFKPTSVSERGWVLLFYCLTSNLNALQKPSFSSLQRKLRWNTWVALDNGSLFLEPNEINVLALLALATHGDSFATPSTSWMLATHACTMAQALNLYSPGHPEYQRRILLFWGLYAVDKSVSLAFGRPPALPTQYYGHVSIPDVRELAGYSPHIDRQEQSSRLQHSPSGIFGASFFVQGIRLSILIGKVCHYLHTLRSSDPMTCYGMGNSLKVEVDNWYRSSMAACSNTLD
jgi:hypothetical protein